MKLPSLLLFILWIHDFAHSFVFFFFFFISFQIDNFTDQNSWTLLSKAKISISKVYWIDKICWLLSLSKIASFFCWFQITHTGILHHYTLQNQKHNFEILSCCLGWFNENTRFHLCNTQMCINSSLNIK